MNILVVSATYPEPDSYALKKDTMAVHYFAKQWVKGGNHVLVVHPFYNGLGNMLDYFRIHKLGIRHCIIDGVNIVFGSSQLLLPHALKPFPFQDRILAKQMGKYIQNHFPSFSPDVISIHFPYVLGEFVNEFCKSEDIPKFAVFHGTDVRQLLSLKEEGRKRWVAIFNNTYKLFGFRAPLLLEKCCESLLDKSKSSVILSGLDESLIADEQSIIEKANTSLNGRPLSIIFAGKLVKQKRIDFVLNALSLIKNDIPFLFYIVGDGEEKNTLQALTMSLGLNEQVEFVGRKSRGELSDLMLRSDMFIMMSTNETLGLVYLEAMAQGCIPIGSKGEGIDGIIKSGENGILCDPYNVQEVSNSIKVVYFLTQMKRKEYILNAFNSVKFMTENKMAESYLRILNQIANTKDDE